LIVVGLTGSMAMGKSTAAGMFRRMGIPVHDADAAVHQALGRGGAAVAAVRHAFPETIVDDRVDRAAMARRVFDDPTALRRLESIVHPVVQARKRLFVGLWRRRRVPLVVLDVPLLFETGGDRDCHAVCVVSAPAFLRRQRILSRPGMDERRIAATLARQMPDAEKRRRADFVIPTGLGLAFTWRTIAVIVDELRRRPTDESSSAGC